MGPISQQHPDCYLLASAFSAAFNYPLWKASAIAQSGFTHHSGATKAKPTFFDKFIKGILPPYRGAPFVITGMTWARAAIFYGSDWGKSELAKKNVHPVLAVALPPLVLSTTVQCINMPLVRASITMQNPMNMKNPNFKSTLSALRYLAREKGVFGLWHGLSAGIIKTVPKYITSVAVKDVMESALPPAESKGEFLLRASVKAVVAGVAGAALTNPFDVLRNEMFKTDLSLMKTIRSLREGELMRRCPIPGAPGMTVVRSFGWMGRGLVPNLIAVSIPITITIFLTDIFVGYKVDLQR